MALALNLPRMTVISEATGPGHEFCVPTQRAAALFFMDETQPGRATLHILTTDPEAPPNAVLSLCPDTDPCSGGYLCDCWRCRAEKLARVKRGVRRSQPLPVRRAA